MFQKIKNFFSISDIDESKGSSRRHFFKLMPGVALGFLFTEKAQAGTWKKISNSANTITPPSGTEILKANSGGQLANAVAGTDYAKPNTSSSWTAKQTFATAIYENKIDLASSAAIDVSTGSVFTKTISGTTTFTVSNTPTTGTVAAFMLELTNPGAATINWWSGVKWANGMAPTLTTSGRDILGFYTHDGGSTWNGFLIAKDIK